MSFFESTPYFMDQYVKQLQSNDIPPFAASIPLPNPSPRDCATIVPSLVTALSTYEGKSLPCWEITTLDPPT